MHTHQDVSIYARCIVNLPTAENRRHSHSMKSTVVVLCQYYEYSFFTANEVRPLTEHLNTM